MRLLAVCLFAMAGLAPSLANAAEPGQSPRRLVLIGDSTVKNGAGQGDGGLYGWGQVLQPLFDPSKLMVENRALGGRSSRTYLTEGHWDRALESLRPGDFVMMQFGHNDGSGQVFEGDRPRASLKGTGDETVHGVVELTGKEETVHTFGWYLRRFVTDAKDRGATPIVLSPVPRNRWVDGRVKLDRSDYGAWAEQIAEEEGAEFIDLGDAAAKRYESAGREKVSIEYFTTNDHTHTNKAGAQVNAECVVEGVRLLEGIQLRNWIAEAPSGGSWLFTLGDVQPQDATAVDVSTLYDPNLGYGFEPGSAVRIVSTEGLGACVADEEFSFSIRLREGRHLVEVTVGAPDEPSTTRIQAELRRKMTGDVSTEAGESRVVRFLVHTRTPTIESGGVVRLKDRERGKEAAAWDDKLTLRFVGDRPSVARIQVSPAPSAPAVFLLGDSTVADQPLPPWASWGQKMPVYFGDRAVVANHSESGETIRGSWGARRFDKVLEQIRPGDWLLVQFGHNDMKSKAADALDQYRDGLRRAVRRARRRGATPVLVTSMERMAGVDGDTLAGYPGAVREVASEMKVPLVDLHAASKELYRELGDDLPSIFQDGTHHNDKGASLLAELVVAGLQEATPELASLVREPATKSP